MVEHDLNFVFLRSAWSVNFIKSTSLQLILFFNRIESSSIKWNAISPVTFVHSIYGMFVIRKKQLSNIIANVAKSLQWMINFFSLKSRKPAIKAVIRRISCPPSFACLFYNIHEFFCLKEHWTDCLAIIKMMRNMSNIRSQWFGASRIYRRIIRRLFSLIN